ncbi:MAG: hypothetical protein ACHQF2_02300 [Flavobacteriales bacterium]
MLWILRNILFYLVLVVVFQVTCNNYLNNDVVWFTQYVVYGGSILLLLILFFKWKSKWTGIRTLNKKSDTYAFTFNKPLQPAFLYWTKYNHVTEAIASFVFGISVLYFDQTAWMFSALLIVNAIENIYFLISNLKNHRFRMAVNEFAVAHNGRGTYIIPFHGLQSIERKYDEFFFIYKNGDTLTIPLNSLEEKDLAAFRQLLDTKARELEIFYSVRL